MNRVALGVLGAVALIATPAFAANDNVPVNVSIEVAAERFGLDQQQQ